MQHIMESMDKKGEAHPIGQSYCLFTQDPVRCLIYINIPKNASSWTKHHMMGSLFNYVTKTFYTDPGTNFRSIPRWPTGLTDLRYLIILRDPIDRWVTGLAQYLQGWGPAHPMHIDNLNWDYVFERVVFDGHTRPQIDFIRSADLTKAIWLRCDSDLAKNFSAAVEQFTGQSVTITPHEQDHTNVFNVTAKVEPTVTALHTTERQQVIVDKIRDKLASDSKYIDRLKTFYREDVELFESVNFFTV